MGLLTILRKQQAKDKQMRVLVLGLDNAGKSTVLSALQDHDINQVAPTLGFEIVTLVYALNEQEYKLNVWDIGGQKSIRSFWRNYFEETDALIWVVDSSDKARMEVCTQELAGVLQQERLLGASLLVLVNKQDQEGCLNVDQVKEGLGIVAGNRNVHYQACSGVTKQGLQEGLGWLVRDVADRIYFLS